MNIIKKIVIKSLILLDDIRLSWFTDLTFKIVKKYSKKSFISNKKSDIAVIMTSWNRENFFSDIIQNLENQTYKNFDFCIWNNNPNNFNKLKKSLKESNLNTVLYQSRNNVGGFGRFYLAKIVCSFKKYKYIVFIDDDQFLEPNFISNFISEMKKYPNSSFASSAFKFKNINDYWDRDSLEPGQKADYLATQGMILKTDIFDDEGIFECPKRFWFIEDLWLSYILKNNNYILRKSINKTLEIETGSFEKNGLFTKPQVKHKKTDFLKFLVRLKKFKTINSINKYENKR